jgi:hypothetical protein
MSRLCLWTVFIAIAVASPASAETFRVTTRIFQDASLEAMSEHKILFDDGLVYDLPERAESRFVTVFDAAQKRVTLLDRQDRVQTTISTDDLVIVAAQTRASATTSQQQQRLGLTAAVEPSPRVVGYMLRFANLEYHTTAQTPDNRAIATEYGQFAVLASQLNLVRRLGPPPFGRMTLSQYLAEKGELPLETTLTVQRGQQSQELRCTHELQQLSETDRETIQEVRGMLELYRDVALKDFP